MWFTYALAFAVASSLSTIIAKKILKDMDQYPYLFFCSLFTIPFLLIIAINFFKIPTLDSTFWLATVIGTIISAGAGMIVFKAIKESELSLVNPISAFNPVFTLIISYLTLGEKIILKDMFGVLIVVLGAYLLQASRLKDGVWEPIKALVNYKGVRLSLLAYFLWAITPTFEKIAIQHTTPQNPPFAALIGQIIAMVIYGLFIAKYSNINIQKIKVNSGWFLTAGILGGIGITCAFLAYSLNSLGIVTAIFKLSMIFTVVLSWLIFKEKNVGDRLLGSFVMLIGVVLIVL